VHGNSYGAKDLLAVKAFPRRGGCALTNQVSTLDATVIQRLAEPVRARREDDARRAGEGETWFGGMTRNPWNLKQGQRFVRRVPLPARRRDCSPLGSLRDAGSMFRRATAAADGLAPNVWPVSRVGAMA